jgi:hypothetical protein
MMWNLDCFSLVYMNKIDLCDLLLDVYSLEMIVCIVDNVTLRVCMCVKIKIQFAPLLTMVLSQAHTCISSKKQFIWKKINRKTGSLNSYKIDILYFLLLVKL